MEHLGVADDGVLDDFCVTLTQFLRRKTFQSVNVAEDQRRMMNHADQVFSGPQIDSGFATNRAVDHREQRCRNLNVRNAALKNGCDKSRNVADHAAA